MRQLNGNSTDNIVLDDIDRNIDLSAVTGDSNAVETGIRIIDQNRVRTVPTAKINGHHCIILPPSHDGDDFDLVPYGSPVDTSGVKKYSQAEVTRLTNAAANSRQESQPLNAIQATLKDPIALLLTGSLLSIFTMVLVWAFMPKTVAPVTTTTCKPDYFLFAKIGETCETKSTGGLTQ